MKPGISVIIPLYNKEAAIEHTVRSVLTQTCQDFELIIVNDGSTDSSFDIVSRIRDSRIRLYSQENVGPSAARNTGVRNAEAEWVVFLDGDDELLPDALKHFSELRERHSGIDIYDCSSFVEKNGLHILKENQIEGKISNSLKSCFLGQIGPGSGHAMFRKTLLELYRYDEGIRRFEDAELIIRMLAEARVYSSKVPTFVINTEYSSASARRDDISEDYAGHLSMKGKSFWGKMCVYRTYLENRDLYPQEMRKLYPLWYYRYDLLILYKLLNRFCK